MRCLLVDDEPGIREGLAALLRKKGHDVRTAGDCAGAAAALAHDHDVVVTDWRLPDGTADAFWRAARCPVIAVSGHPEEVRRDGPVVDVLTKPVTPTRLLQRLAELAPAAAPEHAPPAPAPLAPDSERAIAAFVAGLPPATAIERHDDGTFVTVVVRPPIPAVASATSRDGDLCWVMRDGRPEGRLRLRRDGRSGTGAVVVGPGEPWPADGELIVDCAGAELAEPQFRACLDRLGAALRQGRRVQLWNVPDALRDVASGHGTAHDMPMREPVGPSLQAESADLWREP